MPAKPTTKTLKSFSFFFHKMKMPKKACSPIFRKVSHLLKTSSVFIPKMRKPNFPTLISLKKSSKLKKMKLLKHYSYAYIQEYEFSPSNTPLIHQYHRKPLKNRDIIYSLFFLCSCFRSGGQDFDRNYPLEIKALPADVAIRELYESSDSGGEEDSVDERAERFIEKFYQDIKMQRKESLLYLTQK